MNTRQTIARFCFLMAVVNSCQFAAGQQPIKAVKLSPFQSKEGGFAVSMPGKPAYSSRKMPGRQGKRTVTHHQFTSGEKTGVFMVTYESLAGTKLDTAKQQEAAYLLARGGMEKILGGKVLEYKHSKLDKKRTGRYMRISIPARRGEYRARMFIVENTLYQVFAMGSPDFVKAKRTDQVLASFKLLKKTKTGSGSGSKKTPVRKNGN